MQAQKTKAELQVYKAKLANSYSELLDQFSSQDLRTVGNYTLGKLIGKGSFGKVYLAKHNLTNGSKVVLKASSKQDGNLAREIHHHRQFIHPHIARLYEVIVTENLVWLVLEYCPGDELYNYLCSKGALPVDTVQKIFSQLLGAVAYIHSKSCVHRDLKLENVLLDKNDNVKLCDFGFTREYEGKANYLQTFCGTICYSAPEMLKGEKYAGEKVDVWSLGIILFALLKGELPFDEDDDAATKAKILKDDPVYPDTFPDAAKTLISKMLSKRPLYRPTIADILADPFLIEFAPQQQAILKLSQPAPFTTDLEKNTLERMKAAGVDIDKVIENVLAQRCDSLAGWWALLIEKEARKEARRERKRKEREAELKILRRLSGASNRLERIAPTLEEVDEEGSPGISGEAPRRRSGSRGRTQRRSTPQILVSDLPQLPEGTAVQSPSSATPPPPIDKDSIRSHSSSRPPPLSKEAKRRSSTLQIVTNNPDLLGPLNGVTKRRGGRFRNSNRHFLSQLTALKHWFAEATRVRPRSPGKSSQSSKEQDVVPNGKFIEADSNPRATPELLTRPGGPHSNRSSVNSAMGVGLTPVLSRSDSNRVKLDTAAVRGRPHRNSLSPSPVTPRSSYRRSSGLRGRKSTSSSVSSIRSMPRHPSHSKASSQSSNSLDTIHSPAHSATHRSPHSSIKVLPVTPTGAAFSNNNRFTRTREWSTSVPSPKPRPLSGTFDHLAVNGFPGPTSASNLPTTPSSGAFGSGVMFARRKKSPFKGPMLNPSLFGVGHVAGAFASPAIANATEKRGGFFGTRRGSGGRELDKAGRGKRNSKVIEEEEEDHGGSTILEQDESAETDVEEVEVFPAIELEKGERIHSITYEPAELSDLSKAVSEVGKDRKASA